MVTPMVKLLMKLVLVVFAVGCNADLPLQPVRSGEITLEPIKYTGNEKGDGVLEFNLRNPFSFAISVLVTSVNNDLRSEVGTEFVKIPGCNVQKCRFNTSSRLYIYDDKGLLLGLINPKHATRSLNP